MQDFFQRIKFINKKYKIYRDLQVLNKKKILCIKL